MPREFPDAQTRPQQLDAALLNEVAEAPAIDRIATTAVYHEGRATMLFVCVDDENRVIASYQITTLEQAERMAAVIAIDAQKIFSGSLKVPTEQKE